MSTPGPTWTLPYALACTAKSPFDPRAHRRGGCRRSLPSDPPLHSMAKALELVMVTSEIIS
jgi:hypothetical protein